MVLLGTLRFFVVLLGTSRYFYSSLAPSNLYDRMGWDGLDWLSLKRYIEMCVTEWQKPEILGRVGL